MIEKLSLEFDELTIEDVEDYLNTQIMDDSELVRIILRTGLSTYTNHPINLMIKAPTSEGKTYAATQVIRIFPDGDVLYLGGMSPTALIHQHGELVDRNGNPIRDKINQLDKKIRETKTLSDKESLLKRRQDLIDGARNVVDLSRKILVFLDTPEWDLWLKLRPILSHDKHEIEFMTTDKKAGSLFTKKTIIKGWPAVIYCSAKNEEVFREWPEIQSRFLIASPNTNSAKYKKAISYSAKKFSIPDFAKKKYKDDERESACQSFVRKSRYHLIELCETENPILNPFNEIISDNLPHNEGKSMRITEKFFSLCNIETLIHSNARLVIDYFEHGNPPYEIIITSLQDIKNAIMILGTQTDISPEKLKFIDHILKPAILESLTHEVTTSKLAEKYSTVFGKNITGKKVLENYIKPLLSLGIVEAKQDPDDHRQYLYQLSFEVNQNTLDDIVSKIIEYSKKNQSFVREYLEELFRYSSDDAVYDIKDNSGNIIPSEQVQDILLNMSQTNNLYNL